MATSPSTANYFVGKGKLYFDRWTSTSATTGERDLGNAPSVVITPNVEQLEHFSSRTGIRSKDFEVDVQESATVKFTLDEISIDNLALALYGDGVEVQSQGDGNVGAESVTLYTDRWVKLQNRNISVSSVGISGYVEDTDFEVDHAIGRIKAINGGSIADGETVSVSYTFGAMTWNYVSLFGRKPVEGLMRLVGTNDVGKKYEIQMWRVKIKSTSDLNFIGDDWGSIEFEGEILNDATNHPDFPFLQVLEEGVDISNS